MHWQMHFAISIEPFFSLSFSLFWGFSCIIHFVFASKFIYEKIYGTIQKIAKWKLTYAATKIPEKLINNKIHNRYFVVGKMHISILLEKTEDPAFTKEWLFRWKMSFHHSYGGERQRYLFETLSMSIRISSLCTARYFI